VPDSPQKFLPQTAYKLELCLAHPCAIRAEAGLDARAFITILQSCPKVPLACRDADFLQLLRESLGIEEA